jgi:hypothetical protein
VEVKYGPQPIGQKLDSSPAKVGRDGITLGLARHHIQQAEILLCENFRSDSFGWSMGTHLWQIPWQIVYGRAFERLSRGLVVGLIRIHSIIIL